VQLEHAFPASPVAIAAIRHAVAGLAERCGMDERALVDVRLAVSEAASNAVVHAYPASEGEIRVTAEVRDGELLVVVADDGPGVAPRPDSPGLGRGLPNIASVARRVEIVSEGRGTQIHLAFDCPASAAA
jgi:anti-sigma regulatory factor (Ser/Thr protein kinase)